MGRAFSANFEKSIADTSPEIMVGIITPKRIIGVPRILIMKRYAKSMLSGIPTAVVTSQNIALLPT